MLSRLPFKNLWRSFYKVSSQVALSIALLIGLHSECIADKGDREQELRKLDGKIIRSITIEVAPVFEGEDLQWLYRTANNLKIKTKEYVIRQDLLISEGDTYDHFRVMESERRLREQRFLNNIKIIHKVDGNSVDLIVHVQDTWTLVPQGTLSNGGGSSKREIGLVESDLLGHGKRVEAMLSEVDGRKDIETVWDDQRLFGARSRLIAAAFDREDGQRYLGSVGLPFRSVLDPYSWKAGGESSDIVGRLFQYGDTRYLYRRDTKNVDLRFTFAPAPTEKRTDRFTFGYRTDRNHYAQATQEDFDVLNLDPEYVSNDISQLPQDRELMGPVFGYELIESNFISLAYIDRFQRVEDYNLGNQFNSEVHIAPKAFGSLDNSFQLFANFARGLQTSQTAFFRGELGVSSRLDDSDFNNTLFRGELKYYNVLGPKFLGDLYLGKHTLASTIFLNYGHDLDGDRQLIAGAGNVLRGYQARAFTGDKLIGVILEDRSTLVEDVLQIMSIGTTVFAEAGGASSSPLGNILGDEIYSDVGVGLRFGFPRSSGGGVIRLDLAVPLRDGPDGTGQFEPRIVASAGQLFGAPTRSETVGAAQANIGLGVGGD